MYLTRRVRSLMEVSGFFYRQNAVNNCFNIKKTVPHFYFKNPKGFIVAFFINPLGSCFPKCLSK